MEEEEEEAEEPETPHHNNTFPIDVKTRITALRPGTIEKPRGQDQEDRSGGQTPRKPISKAPKLEFNWPMTAEEFQQ